MVLLRVAEEFRIDVLPGARLSAPACAVVSAPLRRPVPPDRQHLAIVATAPVLPTDILPDFNPILNP